MSELPRLLLCSFDVIPGPSGSSRRLTEYLRDLSDHFNVVVLSAKTPDHPHIEKFQGARLLRVPVGSGDLASRLQAFDRAVRRQLESEEYVIAHFTDPFGGYGLCELRESYGYRLVYEAQAFPSQELRFTHPQLEGDRKFLAKVRRQELFCLMNADRVITGSDVTRSLIQTLGVPREQVEVLRAPVDLATYSKEALGEPDATPMRAIYLGSQAGWQGLPTLLRAMQVALREVDLRLVIVGPAHPAWQPLLQDLVEELKLGGKVEFQPPVAHADVHKVLATADVGVLPLDDQERNRVQGGALAKVADYLAAGRPVIASDLPISREFLTDDVALFHEPGDPEDLGECLIELARNPQRRVKMGRAARIVAQRNHDARAIRARVRQIYAEIAGLSSAVRRADDEEAGGPAPTQIGTPSPIKAGVGSSGRKRGTDTPGTDPAIQPQELAATAPGNTPPTARDLAAARSDSTSAERRKLRRRRRREEADHAAHTDPAAVHGDAPRVVMGTPLRDESRAESDGRGTEPGTPIADLPVVMGSPIRDEPAPVVSAGGPPIAPQPPRSAPRADPSSVIVDPSLTPTKPIQPPSEAAKSTVSATSVTAPNPSGASALSASSVGSASASGASAHLAGAGGHLVQAPAAAPVLPSASPGGPAAGGPALLSHSPAAVPAHASAPAPQGPAVPAAPSAPGAPSAHLPTSSAGAAHSPPFSPSAAPSPTSGAATSHSVNPSGAGPHSTASGGPTAATASPAPSAAATHSLNAPALVSSTPSSAGLPRAAGLPSSASVPAAHPPSPALTPPRPIPTLTPAASPPAAVAPAPAVAPSRSTPVPPPPAATASIPPPPLPPAVTPSRPMPVVGSTAASVPPVLTPARSTPPPAQPVAPAPLSAHAPAAVFVPGPRAPSGEFPVAGRAQVPVAPPAPVVTPPPLPAVRVKTPADAPEEIDPDEVQAADDEPAEVSSDDVVEATDSIPTAEVDTVPTAELETADDAVLEPADGVQDAAGAVEPVIESRMDAWFAQLVHGYCPPEGAQFQRPTPPTNFPGREGPPPATVQPSAPVPQSFPSRSGGG